ncbi:MAG: hypothetical protein J3R72DRAFT_436705 [Linnemannia gamsii]|nr:MAG: hypothetical protein J3R72DRAFT_436705 [Linnemannia gamsii]
MSTQAQGPESTGVSGNRSVDHYPKPVASNPPSAQFTNGLLVASGTAFLTGIFGSLWYQSRRERLKGSNRPLAGLPVGPSLQSLNDLKMAESLLKEGRMLGFKAFAIATTMCISGAVLVVGSARWALDVETIPEFSAKMRELFPKQKAKFVDAVVGADRSVFGEQRQKKQTLSGAIGGSADEDEKDLDHEEDNNILGRIERELRRLESEEEESLSTIAPATATIDSSSTRPE